MIRESWLVGGNHQVTTKGEEIKDRGERGIMSKLIIFIFILIVLLPDRQQRALTIINSPFKGKEGNVRKREQVNMRVS